MKIINDHKEFFRTYGALCILLIGLAVGGVLWGVGVAVTSIRGPRPYWITTPEPQPEPEPELVPAPVLEPGPLYGPDPVPVVYCRVTMKLAENMMYAASSGGPVYGLSDDTDKNWKRAQSLCTGGDGTAIWMHGGYAYCHAHVPMIGSRRRISQ